VVENIGRWAFPRLEASGRIGVSLANSYGYIYVAGAGDLGGSGPPRTSVASGARSGVALASIIPFLFCFNDLGACRRCYENPELAASQKGTLSVQRGEVPLAASGNF
jgi:hypothetical protein